MASSSLVDPRLHRHVLHLENRNEGYVCDGCREHGSGERFHCIQSRCGARRRFHKFCARPEQDLNHPFFRGCWFNLMTNPVGSDGGYYCSACAKPVQGRCYRCGHTHHDRYLHPCCATLKPTVRVRGVPGDAGAVDLRLVDRLTSDCLRCGVRKMAVERHRANRTFFGWGDVETVHTWDYATSDGEYSVHVACMKKLMAECWERRVFRRDERTQTFGTDMAGATTSINLRQVWLPTARDDVGRRRRKMMGVMRFVASLAMSMFGLVDPMSFLWAVADVLRS